MKIHTKNNATFDDEIDDRTHDTHNYSQFWWKIIYIIVV